MTEQIEQTEQETVSTDTTEAEQTCCNSALFRAAADDYAYFVKVLIDAGLNEVYAYKVLEFTIKS